MIPDSEKIIGTVLRSDPAVSALGARVVGKTPEDTRPPWVRVTQLDAPAVDRPHHLFEFYLQLDCYAGAEGVGGSQAAQAHRVVEAVGAAIARLDEEGYSGTDAVVSGAVFNGGIRVPDDDFTPSRERFIATARVWIHAPVPA